MRIIVAHKSPDLDSITSMWLLYRFLPGWEHAELDFVPAGEKLAGTQLQNDGSPIEKKGEIDVIHVDTGLGPLDHHQTDSTDICAARLTFDFVIHHPNNALSQNKNKTEAVRRIVEFAVDIDHFQEVYYHNPASDVYDLAVVSILDGFQMMYPGEDEKSVRFAFTLLDALLHTFEKKIWAEEEIKEKGIEFQTRWGKGLAVETENDGVLKLAQKMGYTMAVRRDPHSGNTRIKVLPPLRTKTQAARPDLATKDMDLTPVYEKVKKRDPEATWFLHVSKRMLLNGSSKNPTMRGSKLSLREVVDILTQL